jgi:hypothetical protein
MSIHLYSGQPIVPSQETTWRPVSEESIFHSDRYKNLKSLILMSFKTPISSAKIAGYIINVQ